MILSGRSRSLLREISEGASGPSGRGGGAGIVRRCLQGGERKEREREREAWYLVEIFFVFVVVALSNIEYISYTAVPYNPVSAGWLLHYMCL